MTGASGHRILSRMRSQKKARASVAANDMDSPDMAHRRQRSHSAVEPRSQATHTRSDHTGHWPPLEFDPLKLNPPIPQAPHAPPRLHERQVLHLETKRSFSNIKNRRPPRLHHSESGFSLDRYRQFDFALDSVQTPRTAHVDQQREQEVELKGWPSPASSVDSNKSWFDDSDDDSQDEDDVAAPTPRRRPAVGSPDDPTLHFIKRGDWKRRGVFFGVPVKEVYTNDADAFDMLRGRW